MAKPWVDWLFLRGHVIPCKLAWRPDGTSSARDHSQPPSRAPGTYQALATLRLCMGIGDGAVRTQ